MEYLFARRGFLGALVLSCLFLMTFGCGNDAGSATYSQGQEYESAPTLIEDIHFVDHTRAVGFFTNGSIQDSVTISNEGPGFVKIFRLRERGYGTASLIRMLELAAAGWRREFPIGDRIQIGDSGDHNGGYISGHGSHQNGLDVDIAYLNRSHVERDPNTNGPGGYMEQFVSGGKVTANFDIARNWGLMKHLVAQGNVGRIFVDSVIKKTFCSQAAALDPALPAARRTEVLRRLRPYQNHADHLHLRLKCPPNHPKCVEQSEPPSGSGCASTSSVRVDEYTEEQRADDELGPDGEV